MENNVSGIYTITNLKNEKKYVGQSQNVNRRIYAHKNKLRVGTHKNAHLQAAWNKYGESSFLFEVVEYCPVSELNTKEMFWINKLGTFSPGGYNMTLGGDGTRGYIPTDVAREKSRELATRYIAGYWAGKTLSDNHKEKLRYAARNRSEETLRKIGEASRRTMANPEIKQRMILHQRCKAVYCVELDAVFCSASDAGRKTNIQASNISKVCRGLIKTSGGYHWKYVDDP